MLSHKRKQCDTVGFPGHWCSQAGEISVGTLSPPSSPATFQYVPPTSYFGENEAFTKEKLILYTEGTHKMR